MAKTSKPQKQWRRQKELLLGITHAEDGRKKWAIAQAIKRKDEELQRQEEEDRERGYCPKCHILRTISKTCTMAC